MLRFADRIGGIEPFRVVEVLRRANELEAAGRDIVHFEAGEPDFSSAEPILAAGQRALAEGHTRYTPAAGIPALRERIAAFYHERHGLDISPERIFLTPGASGALLLALSLTLNPGDGVLLTDPGYPCNRSFVRLLGGVDQLVPVGPAEHYQLNVGNAAAAWRDNTRALMIASPANPTGEIIARNQLMELAQFSAARHASLLVDEIYHGLGYEGEAPSILEFTDRALVINSFSKYFGMTGWRLGWLVVPEEAIDAAQRLSGNLFISMSSVAQHAALAAFEPATIRILEARREAFRARRDLMVAGLRETGFGIARTPPGALYVYADCRAFGRDSEALCMELLEQAGVALTPGTDFGLHLAREHVRFSFTTGIERIEEGLRRLQRHLA